MKIMYTPHAEERLRQRSIKKDDDVEIIEFPDYTLKRGEEIEAYKKIKERTIKVVYIAKGNYIKVITVYPLG